MTEDHVGGDLKGYEATEALGDGSIVRLRAVRPDDEDMLLSFFRGLRPRTAYLRFHRTVSEIAREEVAHLCDVDYRDAFGLVGIVATEGEEKVIANGHFFRLPMRDAAEMSLVVDDSFQGRGVGARLLDHLAIMARQSGIRYLESEVLAENKPTMKMLKSRGFQVAQGLEQGVYRVVLSIEPTEVVEESAEAREKVATVARLRAFLRPRSVAVVGASPKERSIGSRLLLNILHHGFNGLVYPVNPNFDVIASLKAYPAVFDIPGEVDLAVVAVPAEKVPEVVLQCGRRGVRGVVVISAGFGESGAEGTARQEVLLETARTHGTLLIGPNSMGILNTDPAVSMNATLSPLIPRPGNIALCSQGGTIGLAILEYAHSLDIGLSTFVNLGNRADISSNDLLEYWEDDPAIRAILLYLESFGNPRKFIRIAPRVARAKPIVAVSSGHMPAGSRAANVYGGRLVTAEATSEDLFRQAGIIRVDTMKQLFDAGSLLAYQPLPRGRRVAVIANGGGPAMVTAYACAALGLELPALMDVTVSELKEILPRRAVLANPVDMTAEATAGEYFRALQLLVEDEGVDSVVVIYLPPIVTEPEAVADAIREVAPRFRRRGKTLVASFMGLGAHAIDCHSEFGGHVPCFTFPEASAAALSRAWHYSEWLRSPKGQVTSLGDIDRERAAKVVSSALRKDAARPLWLDIASIGELLECYGIRVAGFMLATTADEAGQVAEEIGFPVAVKLLSDTIVRRTQLDGVVLDLRSRPEVSRAFDRIKESLARSGREDEMKGVIVQKMIEGGVEVLAGVTHDHSFGPLIMFGTGGIYADVFKDVAFHLHPLTDTGAGGMIRTAKVYQLLEGWRGSGRSDIEALEELLLRVSAMVEDLPQIAEMDLNPVKALDQGNGYAVIDARIMLS